MNEMENAFGDDCKNNIEIRYYSFFNFQGQHCTCYTKPLALKQYDQGKYSIWM